MERKKYGQFFGLAVTLPIAIVIITIAATSNKYYANAEKERIQRKSVYNNDNATKDAAIRLEKKAKAVEEQLTTWKEKTNKEIDFYLSNKFKEQATKLERGTFHIASYNPSTSSNTSSIPFNKKNITMNIRGTYKSIQEAALRCEADVPNMFLQSYDIKTNDKKTINLNTKFTIWYQSEN